jgi:tetratricopeptide (TPR) repeat protein
MSDRIARLQSFLAENPNDCFLNHALALEYIKLGDDPTARLIFERNQMFDPSYVATYYHLGKLLERIGEPEEALKIYDLGMQQAKAAGDGHSYNELQAAYEDLAY